MMGKYDFLAIGDTVVDAFIRIKDASVHCDLNRENCELCVRFGDKVPYESVEVVYAVGNSANAAVSASRLGLKAALMADIGKDSDGKMCLKQFKKNGVSTKFITAHRGIRTNYHYVLWFEDERTILVKHEEYKRKFNPPKVLPKWVYLSSLGADSLNYQLEIAKWIESHPEVNLAFQPGTFQMILGPEKLGPFYKNAKIFFCNVQEAQRILKTEEKDVKVLIRKMHELGPKIVVITDGPKGACASDGKEVWFMPPYPDPKPPLQRTGAGDAFASTFTSAIILGKSVSEALLWAPINSMSVVQGVGAQKGLLTKPEIEEYLSKAPADYKPKVI